MREEARCWEEGLSRGEEVVQQEEEVEGSSSEDEGLGSSPPLSPEKPLSPQGTLERIASHHQFEEEMRSSFSGLVTPPRSQRAPAASHIGRLTNWGMMTPTRLSKNLPHQWRRQKTSQPRNLSPPFHKSAPREFSPLNFGSLNQPGVGTTTPPLKRVLKLRRVEGLSSLRNIAKGTTDPGVDCFDQ